MSTNVNDANVNDANVNESASRGERLTIELDTVLYGTVAAWVAEVAEIGVVATLVTEHGPAGGTPVFEYTGTRTQLRALVRTYFEADRPNGFTSDQLLEGASAKTA